MARARETRLSLANIAAIPKNLRKMQQKFNEFKERSVEEMNVLRQENSRLGRKLEAEGVADKGKQKEILYDPYTTQKTSPCVVTLLDTEEVNKYNPTRQDNGDDKLLRTTQSKMPTPFH